MHVHVCVCVCTDVCVENSMSHEADVSSSTDLAEDEEFALEMRKIAAVLNAETKVDGSGWTYGDVCKRDGITVDGLPPGVLLWQPQEGKEFHDQLRKDSAVCQDMKRMVHELQAKADEEWDGWTERWSYAEECRRNGIDTSDVPARILEMSSREGAAQHELLRRERNIEAMLNELMESGDAQLAIDWAQDANNNPLTKCIEIKCRGPLRAMESSLHPTYWVCKSCGFEWYGEVKKGSGTRCRSTTSRPCTGEMEMRTKFNGMLQCIQCSKTYGHQHLQMEERRCTRCGQASVSEERGMIVCTSCGAIQEGAVYMTSYSHMSGIDPVGKSSYELESRYIGSDTATEIEDPIYGLRSTLISSSSSSSSSSSLSSLQRAIVDIPHGGARAADVHCQEEALACVQETLKERHLLGNKSVREWAMNAVGEFVRWLIKRKEAMFVAKQKHDAKSSGGLTHRVVLHLSALANIAVSHAMHRNGIVAVTPIDYVEAHSLDLRRKFSQLFPDYQRYNYTPHIHLIRMIHSALSRRFDTTMTTEQRLRIAHVTGYVLYMIAIFTRLLTAVLYDRRRISPSPSPSSSSPSSLPSSFDEGVLKAEFLSMADPSVKNWDPFLSRDILGLGLRGESGILDDVHAHRPLHPTDLSGKEPCFALLRKRSDTIVSAILHLCQERQERPSASAPTVPIPPTTSSSSSLSSSSSGLLSAPPSSSSSSSSSTSTTSTSTWQPTRAPLKAIRQRRSVNRVPDPVIHAPASVKTPTKSGKRRSLKRVYTAVANQFECEDLIKRWKTDEPQPATKECVKTILVAHHFLRTFKRNTIRC